MRRIMLLLIALLLCGCSYQNNDSKERDSITKYESYLATLVEQDRFTDSSYYYDIEAYLNPLNDGTIRYDIIIENPQVAMYDIEILAVESIAKRSDTIIYPCVGIFEEESYTMIPFQKNEEEGYVEAFLLSGISGVQSPVLNVLVTWTDYSKLNTYREFIKLFPTIPEVKDEVKDVVVE
ncbi:MAG: hypothetical protein E7191_06605 [Erysipelotrichaceae bacterium]|nr:hypothetical protein [Erysipelotrichaceae bacterium]MBQ9987011.1 hypothetical protein [Erysipelotrichales bacterium]MBR3693381.1 hypothetical protein [Erysipelotrichales bacterium]